MRIVACARVSSAGQRDGYSLDAQLRLMDERAEREGWKIIRRFEFSETASKVAKRKLFRAMLEWVEENRERLKIGGILWHKQDRALRNLYDAWKLPELHRQTGLRLLYAEGGEYEDTPQGQLTWGVNAVMASYYSANLRQEVLKGMTEKVRQGWLPGHVPFGYRNTRDGDAPIIVDEEQARTVRRAFELFVRGNTTVDAVRERLDAEGCSYTHSCPQFPRNTLRKILQNPFYIGRLVWAGKQFEGKHQPLVDPETFRACQDVFAGRNHHVSGVVHLPLAGGLLRCGFCTQAITGERIKKPLKGGGVNLHYYYRCCHPDAVRDHPKLRWRAAPLEAAIEQRLRELTMPGPIAQWFAESARAALAGEKNRAAQRLASLRKRETDLQNMQTKLLDVYLKGAVLEDQFARRNTEFQAEVAQVRAKLAAGPDAVDGADRVAARVLRFAQNAAGVWRGSNAETRRAILDVVCLNRRLDAANVTWDWRSPFDVLVVHAD